jgi:hypothetical protein
MKSAGTSRVASASRAAVSKSQGGVSNSNG